MAASRGLSERSRQLVAQIVDHVKSQGIFDQFRRDCLEELERKESYRQLKQRVESHVATFLSKQEWTDSLPKNQVRDSLRRNFHQSEVLQKGVERLVSQALNEQASSFRERIGDVVQTFMFSEQQHETTNKLKQEVGKEEKKGPKSDGKLSTVSDVSQLIPSSYQAHSSAEQKPKLRATENTRAVAGRKNEDHAMAKASQVKPIIFKTVSSANVGIKAAEVDHVTVNRAVGDPASLSGNDANDGGNAVHEREISQADPPTSSSGKLSGQTETKEGIPEDEDDVPVTLHIEQNEASSLNPCQLEESMDCLHEERKWTEEEDIRNEEHAEPGRRHSPMKISYPSTVNAVLVDTSANSSSKSLVDMEARAWSPDSAEHAVGLSHEDSEGSPHKTEQDQDKGAISDLSDTHSDISEVSSVHTSDLSSFDDQVSSVTDEEEEDPSPHIDDSDDDGTEESNPQHERPRRSTRISSRSSTREDEEEQNENEPKRNEVKGITSEAKQEPRKDAGQNVEVVKRKRGRPRKTDRPPSHVGHGKSHQARKRKSRRQVETQQSDGESSDVARKRSRRRIKRTRCYSPSSEGTREVYLPYKRSRVSSKD